MVHLQLTDPGNLPFTATKEQIQEHFAKLKPTEIRMRTYKKDNKFMGTCFVEFDRYDRMEQCLTSREDSYVSCERRNNWRQGVHSALVPDRSNA